MPIWRLDIRVTELSIKQLVVFKLITWMKVVLRTFRVCSGVRLVPYKPLFHYAFCPDTGLDYSLKSMGKLQHKGGVSAVCTNDTGRGTVWRGHHPQVTVERLE